MSLAEKLAMHIRVSLKTSPESGKRKLALVIRQSEMSELARAIRFYFNRRMHAPLSGAEPMRMIGMTDLVEILVNNLDSGDPDRVERAKAICEKISETHPEIEREISEFRKASDALMGFGFSSITGSLKKAGNAMKKAAKAVKKHDFKKDIAIANKVGKVVGPLAASAPPPYGPAIAGACMVLDAADKYNKGAVDQIDATKLAAAVGIEDSENMQALLATAQTIKNNEKATALIKAAASKGDVAAAAAAVAKIKGIKELAQKGGKAAQGALEALKSAKIGVKLSDEQKKTIAFKALPQSNKMQAIMKASRVIETPQGPVNILNRNKHGAALLYNMIVNEKKAA